MQHPMQHPDADAIDAAIRSFESNTGAVIFWQLTESPFPLGSSARKALCEFLAKWLRVNARVPPDSLMGMEKGKGT